MKQLTIHHNHGVLVLANVTMESYEYDARQYGGHSFTGHVASGTVVNGHSTSRLFWATSTQHDTPGKTKRYDIYGHRPQCSNKERDEWVVSVQSCG